MTAFFVSAKSQGISGDIHAKSFAGRKNMERKDRKGSGMLINSVSLGSPFRQLREDDGRKDHGAAGDLTGRKPFAEYEPGRKNPENGL